MLFICDLKGPGGATFDIKSYFLIFQRKTISNIDINTA